MNTTSRPNVLILHTDQQRKDSVGCYGSDFAVTPNLDRLAGAGIVLDNFFVQNSVCMPSRMSFLTGRYPSSLGVGCNGVPFPHQDAIPLPRIMKSAGYSTGMFGKLHFYPNTGRDHTKPYPHMDDLGFDEFLSAEGPGTGGGAYTAWLREKGQNTLEAVRRSITPTERIYGAAGSYYAQSFDAGSEVSHSAFVANEICRFISRQREKPFFAFAGFFAPHAPIVPPSDALARFDDTDMPLPVLGPDEKTSSEIAGITDEEWQRLRAHYYALVSHVDDCVGDILACLEESGQADNTIIVFTSDHGEYIGDHGEIAKGMPGYDCIINVPCIVRLPSSFSVSGDLINRSCELAEAVDIVPTILDYCCIETPKEIQGRSLKPLFQGATSQHRDSVLVESFIPAPNFDMVSKPDVPGMPSHQATVRTRRFMYNLSSSGQELLFDMERDPGQLSNVVTEPFYASELSELRKLMSKRLLESALSSRERIARW